MDESEKAKFSVAEELWRSGDVTDAVRVHFDLCRNARDPRVRLSSAMALVDRLKLIQAPERLLQVCSVGMESAKQLSDAKNQALFMAKRAECLVSFNGISLIHARKKLKMAPGWFAFALERDEQQYGELTRQIEANEKEADTLISSALAICDGAADNGAKGRVMMCAGNMAFQRYLSHKLEDLPSRLRLPRWLRSRLREYRLDEYVLYTGQSRRQMRRLVEECEARFIEAARLFQDAAEEEMMGYAFYNLANDLRSAYRFTPARRYLRKARVIAERHGQQKILRGVQLLERSIRARNRDTPNYAAGETRQPDDLP